MPDQPFVKPPAVALSGVHVSTQAFGILTFALLTAVGAQIIIPHNPVPFTLQTFFVLLSGALLGTRNGFASMALYILLGALGLPVFSGLGSGVSRIFGPTGGYLLAFPLASMIVGALVARKSSHAWTLFSMAIALLAVFLLGTTYLHFFYLHDLKASVTSGFLLFTWWDLLKVAAATGIYSGYVRWLELPAR